MSEKIPLAAPKRERSYSELEMEARRFEEELSKEHPELFAAQKKVEDAKHELIKLLSAIENKDKNTQEAVKAMGVESGRWAVDTALLKIPSTIRKLSSIFGDGMGNYASSYNPPSVGEIYRAAEDLYELAKLRTDDRALMDTEAAVAEAEFEQQMLLIKGDPEELLEYHKKCADLLERQTILKNWHKK